MMFRVNHGKLSGLVGILGVLVLVGLSGQSVQADPLMFSNARVFQNNYTSQIDLFLSQGSAIVGPNLSFRVDLTGTLPPSGTDVLKITYAEAGSAPQIQTYVVPVFGSVYPPLTLFFSFASPSASAQGVSATLTVDLLNSSPDFIVPSGIDVGQLRDSNTYSFNVVQPVPEPVTVLGFGAGLVVIARRRRQNLKQD